MLYDLYGSILVGNCPCHGFGKVSGNTGGFYYLLCRHGVNVYCLKMHEHTGSFHELLASDYMRTHVLLSLNLDIHAYILRQHAPIIIYKCSRKTETKKGLITVETIYPAA